MAKNTMELCGLNVVVAETLPVGRITSEVAAGIFGLTQNPDGRWGFMKGETRTDDGETIVEPGIWTESTVANVESWIHLPTGWNAGNRPASGKHIANLVEMAQNGEYYPNAHLVLVFDTNGTVGNGQHTLAMLVILWNQSYSVEGEERTVIDYPEYMVDGIQMVIVQNLPDACIDLLDSGRARTLKDALARRGIGMKAGKVDRKELPAIASATRFLNHRYTVPGGGNITGCKEKLGIKTGVELLFDSEGKSDVRFADLHQIFGLVESVDKGMPKSDGKGFEAKNRLSGKPSTTNPDALGIPAQYLLFVGQVLRNGKKAKNLADFGTFLRDLTFGKAKEKTCLTSLREYCRKSASKTSRTPTDFWDLCRALILTFLDWNSEKSNPDFSVQSVLDSTKVITLPNDAGEVTNNHYLHGLDTFAKATKSNHPNH